MRWDWWHRNQPCPCFCIRVLRTAPSFMTSFTWVFEIWGNGRDTLTVRRKEAGDRDSLLPLSQRRRGRTVELCCHGHKSACPFHSDTASARSVTQSCLIRRDSIDCSSPGSAVHGTVQARILEWVAKPSSRGPSRPRDRTQVCYVSCIAGKFFTTSATWEAQHATTNIQSSQTNK